MPKGQSPSKRMDARRDAYDAEFQRLTGGDIPKLPIRAEGEPVPRGIDALNRAANKLARMRRRQLSTQNAAPAAAASAKVDKIDTTRENEAMRAGRARKRMQSSN